jgi:outer membrane receptor for ferrienterochelin and colicin
VNAKQRDAKFNVKVGWTPNGTDEYAISHVGQRGEKGNPPYAGADTGVKIRYWQWPYWDQDSVYLVANKHLGSSNVLRVRACYDTYGNALHSYDDKTCTTQNTPSSFKSLCADHTYGGSAESGMNLGRRMLRAAGHFKRDQHEDHNVGSPASHFDGRLFSLGVEDSWVLAPKAANSGVAFDVRSRILPRTEVGFAYTCLRRENISSPTTPLVDTPRHEGRASLTVTPLRPIQVVASADFEAGRRVQNEAGHYLDAPSFAVLDLEGIWTVRRGLSLEAGVRNLFDRSCWRADGYPEPGRTAQVSLRCSF